MKGPVYYLLLCLFLMACNTSQNAVMESSSEVRELISIRKSPCFGTCPVYTMTVFTDHSMIYKGTKYTEKLGIFEKVLPVEDYNQLVQLIERTHIMDMDDLYPTMVSDMPSTTITLFSQDSVKSVKAYNEAPDKFKTLAEELEKISNTSGWKDLSSTDADEIENQIIIHFNKKIDPESWGDAMNQYDLKIIKRISPKLNYWLASYNVDSIGRDAILRALTLHKDVIIAEFNQKVSIR